MTDDGIPLLDWDEERTPDGWVAKCPKCGSYDVDSETDHRKVGCYRLECMNCGALSQWSLV